MTKHSANPTTNIASHASVAVFLDQIVKAATRLLSLRISSSAAAELPRAIRYDIGEEDCRPPKPQSLHAQLASQQTSLDRMRMRSF